MEDAAVIELYWQRDENAVRETERKYGPYLTRIAANILSSPEDAQECVGDVYWKAWGSIPPQRPRSLPAYLATLTRQGAIDALRRRERHKRGGGQYDLSLEELADCVSAADDPAGQADLHALGAAISAYLRTLSPDVRDLFVCRYWYADPLADAAKHCGMTVSRAKSALYRARLGLKTYLEQEGFDL